jgi:hypothetical protein
MNVIKFATYADAVAAGYRSPIRSGQNRDKDVSGPNKFGYVFENEGGDQTVTVWFTNEKNKMGGTSSFAPMFPPSNA